MMMFTEAKVDEFFSERELNKNFKIDSPEALIQFLSDMPRVKRNLKENGAQLVFRGQPESQHGLQPSLYRAIEKELFRLEGIDGKSRKISESLINKVELSLLKTARAEGLGRNLSDMNLLALLQHHGIPTRLLDVSRDPLVALYFAVANSESRPGRLFIFSVKGESLKDPKVRPHSLFAGLPWGNLRGRLLRPIPNWTQRVFIPDFILGDSRIRAQNATFLVGGLASPSGKFQLYLKSRQSRGLDAASFRKVTSLMTKFAATSPSSTKSGSWDCTGWTLTVPAGWKEEIRHRLEKVIPAISRDFLFPPIWESERLLRHATNTSIKNFF